MPASGFSSGFPMPVKQKTRADTQAWMGDLCHSCDIAFGLVSFPGVLAQGCVFLNLNSRMFGYFGSRQSTLNISHGVKEVFMDRMKSTLPGAPSLEVFRFPQHIGHADRELLLLAGRGYDHPLSF